MSQYSSPTPVARHQSFAEHRPNVFAIGDVRCGSTKRVASAVGDGALVVRSMHEALNRSG